MTGRVSYVVIGILFDLIRRAVVLNCVISTERRNLNLDLSRAPLLDTSLGSELRLKTGLEMPERDSRDGRSY